MRFILLLVSFFNCSLAWSTTVNQSIYLNKGSYTAVDSSTFTYLAFNPSSVFNKENLRIHISQGDSLILKVFNTDSVAHGFNITQHSGVSTSIAAGDSTIVSVHFPGIGLFIYYDDANYPYNRYMGLAGMIVVESTTASKFYWNIKEHQKAWNQSIDSGGVVNWLDYYPDYFTINSNSNPDINADPMARVIGSVGDTIRIYIANTGQSAHSIHFHGYHCKTIYASKGSQYNGRSKDTFPVNSMETMILELIPHQVGEYPVHDHNLVAVSGGKVYPNGMFLTILIQ